MQVEEKTLDDEKETMKLVMMKFFLSGVWVIE